MLPRKGIGKLEVKQWLFILGLALVAIAGIIYTATGTLPGGEITPKALVILGVIVGLLNVSERDFLTVLVACFTFLAGSSQAAGLSTINLIGPYLMYISQYLAIFIAPFAFTIALRAILRLAISQ